MKLPDIFTSRKQVYIFFLIILGLIVVANMHPGYLLIGNDNFSPEVNPGLTLDRGVLSPGWRTYRALGVPSDSEQADIFRTGVFYLLSLVHIPAWVLSQIYFFLTLGIGLFSAGHVARLLFSSRHKDDPAYIFFGGLFYISSLLTIWVYYFPVHLFIAAYAFLPLVAWRILTYAKRSNLENILLLIIASLMLSTTGLTATIFLTTIGAIALTLLATFGHKRISAKKSFIGLAIVLLVNMYWLLPFEQYVSTNTSSLQDSLINRKITNLQVQNEQRFNSLQNILRHRYSWLDDKLSTGAYAYTSRDWYVNNPLGIALGYLPILLAGGAAYALYKKKRRIGLILGAQALLGIFLIKGSNPPFGFIYGYVENVSSVFEQVFRWRSSKFWPLLALSVPLLATYASVFIYKKKRAAIAIIIALLMLVYIYPLFIGHMVRPSMYTKIPQEYYELAEYLEQANPRGRIYAAPEANTVYFRNYEWDFFGSVILNYLIPNPVFEKALVIGSQESEEAFNIIKDAYYSRDHEAFLTALRYYKVEYVLSDTNVVQGESGYSYDFELHTYMVAENPALIEVWRNKDIVLYQVPPVLAEIVPVVPGHKGSALALRNAAPGRVVREQYVENESGSLYPLMYDFHNIVANESNQELILEDTITLSGRYGLNIDPSHYLKAPSDLQYIDRSVIVKPLFPTFVLDGKALDVPVSQKEYSLNSDSEFISVDGIVIPRDERATNTQSFDSFGGDTDVRGWNAAPDIDVLTRGSGIELTCQSDSADLQVLYGEDLACGTGPLHFDEDMLLNAQLSTSSDSLVSGSLCISSALSQSCLNQKTQFTVDGEKNLKFTVPRIITRAEAQGNIELFLTFSSMDNEPADVDIRALTLTPYFDKAVSSQYSYQAPQDYELTFDADGSIPFEVHIPYFTGQTALTEGSFTTSKLSSSISPEDESFSAHVVYNEVIEVDHTNSAATLFTQLRAVPYTFSLIHVAGENISGIPADIRIRHDKQGAFVYENKMLRKDLTSIFDYFITPQGNPNLNIELRSLALGPRPTVTLFNTIMMQPMPAEWLDIAIEPVEKPTPELVAAYPVGKKESNIYVTDAQAGDVITLNTAYSPHWSIRRIDTNSGFRVGYLDYVSGEKVQSESLKVNGWEQSFTVEEDGRYIIIFKPNIYVYTGYILVGGLVAGLVVLQIMRLASKRDEADLPS